MATTKSRPLFIYLNKRKTGVQMVASHEKVDRGLPTTVVGRSDPDADVVQYVLNSIGGVIKHRGDIQTKRGLDTKRLVALMEGSFFGPTQLRTLSDGRYERVEYVPAVPGASTEKLMLTPAG